MRIAVVSDIHGNLTAFEAVLADLGETSPDLILHGGDLAGAGSSPAQIVDRIRALGWQGVLGNADQMLFAPESLSEFASQSSAPQSLWTAIAEEAAWTRASLGEERLQWLRDLPRLQILDRLALVHASPATTWRAPAHTAPDAELDSIYSPLARPVVVYGHIHVPFIRHISRSEMIVANTGGVSLSYDGDPRAAYLLLDESEPTIRRVEYDVAKEIKALAGCGTPHADWIARMLETAAPQMP
jgi:predicted phosphodiesterase